MGKTELTGGVSTSERGGDACGAWAVGMRERVSKERAGPGTHGLSAGGKRESRGWAGLIAGPAQKKRKEMGRGGVRTGWAREEEWAGFGFVFLVSFSISIFLFQTLLKPN